MRKTKIVCTLGLVSNSAKVVGEMMDSGMNVARFNFSHGDHDSHKKTLDLVKRLRDRKGIPVATLLDTKGPEIRLGMFKNDKVEVKAGDEFTIYMEEVLGDSHGASVTFNKLDEDVKKGNTILLDDGLIELEVVRVEKGKIITTVINGGPLSNRKGVNIPKVSISMPYISEQDAKDIEFGMKEGFDFVAASFVRNAEDVYELRNLMNSFGGEYIKIISKIENAEGVENIDEILTASDGIMVARGDMGVEIPMEELPYLQKMLIRKAYSTGKMVITATQMLESMITNPRPTRAEVSDVANAVYDGTSAVMLSGESAAGKYPVKAVETMAKIVMRTEKEINYRRLFYESPLTIENNSNVTDAISHATCTTAYHLGAASIITVTISGRTARNISKFRPDTPILGCTSSQKTYHQLALTWGVVPVKVGIQENVNELMDVAVDQVLEQGIIKSGDLLIIAAGVPLGVAGTTNLLKVHVAGDVLVIGQGINTLSWSGTLCVAESPEEALEKFNPGEILVLRRTTNELMPILRLAKGIVVEEAGLESHAAVVGLTLEIPVIVGAESATKILTSGTRVTVDAERGVVRSDSTSYELKS